MSDDQNRVDDAASPTFVPSGYQMEQSAAMWQRLWETERDRVLIDEELDLDERVIAAAFKDADAVDLRTRVKQLVHACKWGRLRATEARAVAAWHDARAKRYEVRVKRWRDMIEQAMRLPDMPRKIEAGEGLIVRIQRASSSLVVTDEGQIPEEWFKIERTLRRRDLGKHLRETGEIIDGVYLSNGGEILVIVGMPYAVEPVEAE